MILGEPALEEGARVDARRGVALEEDLVAHAVGVLAAEEVVEADFVEGRGADAYVARWPPMPGARVLARRTIATAFQRIMRRMRSSIASSPGKSGSCSGEIVLM